MWAVATHQHFPIGAKQAFENGKRHTSETIYQALVAWYQRIIPKLQQGVSMCVGVRKEVLEVGLHVLGVTLCGFYSMLHSAPKVADEFRRVAANVWVSKLALVILPANRAFPLHFAAQVEDVPRLACGTRRKNG